MTKSVLSSSPSFLRILVESTLIALLYMALAQLGYTMAQGPDTITLLWPAAGLAFAAFFTFGMRAFWGVAIGVLADHLFSLSGDSVILASILITAASTSQAAIAAWLMGRLTGAGIFANAGDDTRMASKSPMHNGAVFTAVVAVTTTIAPSVGTASLMFGNLAHRSEVINIWMTWWLGDFSGMLAFGPLFSSLIMYLLKRPYRRDPVIMSLAALIAGAGIFLFALDRQIGDNRLTSDLDAIVIERKAIHYGMLRELINDAIYLRSYFETSEHVSLEEFHSFASLILANDTVKRTMEWAPRVSSNERQDFERKIRDEGLQGFFIHDYANGESGTPSPERNEYFPITYIWPYQENAKALGLDFGSETARRGAIERARDSGLPSATAPLSLVQNSEEGWGVIVSAPVYLHGYTTRTIEERRAAFEAVVQVVFYPNNVMAQVSKQLRPTDVELFLYDIPVGAKDRDATLIAWQPSISGAQQPPKYVDPNLLRHGIYAETQFEFAGRGRLLIVRPGPMLVENYHGWDGWGALGFCWLLTGTLLHTLGRREAQLKKLRDTEDARHSEQIFTLQLMEKLPIGVTLRNMDGSIIDVNPAFANIMGRTRNELRGTVSSLLIPPESASVFESNLENARNAGKYGPVEVDYIHADGHRVPLLVSGLRVERAGEPVILSVAEDITERQEAQFKLMQAQKMDAIGQLTGGLAHDFNNMLGIIIGNLDLALNKQASFDTVRSRAETARAAALHGADLCRTLLSVARKHNVAPEPVDINSWLNELLPLIKHTVGNVIQVVMDFQDAPIITVDTGGLSSTILNLVINARDAMPDGGQLTLSTELHTIDAFDTTTLPNGDYVVLSVSDTGTGMDPKVLEHAIDPFFTTKERGRGTGLGLAMAYGFARQAKGDLRIFSEKGKYTKVSIHLPITPEAKLLPRDITSLPRGTERVLAVDDDIEMLALTSVWLSDLGYEVTPCSSPTSALAVLAAATSEQRPYALMVTDILMQGMNGFELAQAARKAQPDLMLLYVTGSVNVVDHADDRPDAEILNKPFQQSALANYARRALDSRKH